MNHSTGLALRNQPVLVTGASGFLGASLCRKLLAAGSEVHAMSRHARDEQQGGIRHWRSRLQSEEALGRLLEDVGPAAIFHLAGQTGAMPDMDHVLPILDSQLTATIRLLVAATTRARESRVVIPASLEEPPEAEGHRPVPASPYGAAKYAVRLYARMFHRLYGTRVVLCRLPMVYGPGQSEGKVIPNTISVMLRGQTPHLTSASRQFDWLFVDDAIEGLIRAGVAPDLDGEELELGSGMLVSLRDVVEMIAERTSSGVRPSFGSLPDRPAPGAHVFNTERARQLIDWEATTSLAAGLDTTIAYYRSKGTDPDR